MKNREIRILDGKWDKTSQLAKTPKKGFFCWMKSKGALNQQWSSGQWYYNCPHRTHFHNPSNKSPVFKYSNVWSTHKHRSSEGARAGQCAHTFSRVIGSEVVWRPEHANQGFMRLLQYRQQGLSPGVVVFGEMSTKNEQLQQQATLFHRNLERSVIVWSSTETNSIAERSRVEKWTVWVLGISRGLGNAGISLIILAFSTSLPNNMRK